MFDASTVGLLCAIAVIFGYCAGLYQSYRNIATVRSSEVERRTRPSNWDGAQVRRIHLSSPLATFAALAAQSCGCPPDRHTAGCPAKLDE